MADAMTMTRRDPFAGERVANRSCSLEMAVPMTRMSIRALDGEDPALTDWLGIKLPHNPSASIAKDGRHALWIGPDEWFILDETEDHSLNSTDLPDGEFSVVDVSHRNVAITVSGPGAEQALNGGCPRDLSLEAFPVGACARTVIGKAEIILYRREESTFHVEVWRSFAKYTFNYLRDCINTAI